MNKDQIKGQIKRAKGNIEKGAGKLVGNESLEAEGHIEEAAGKVQSAYGDLRNTIDKKT